MKLIRIAFLVTAALAFNASAQPAPGNPPPNVPPGMTPRVPPGLAPKSPPIAPAAPPVMPDKDKLSYAIGYNVASSIKRDDFDVDVDTLAAGMKDVLAGRPTRFSSNEVKDIMTQFQGAMRAKMMADRDKLTKEAQAKSEAFLAQNAKAPGVTVLPNGLQYKVIKEGTGEMPKPTDSVVVAYKGKLIDGTVFDQNEHFPTKVTGQTIRGWSEILPLMKTGSKWEVTIPSDLGYGMRGSPPRIPPSSVLIFEMELLSVTNSPAAPPKPAPTPVSMRSTPPSPPAPTGMTSTPVVSGQIIKVPSKDEMDKGAKIEVITNAPQ